MARVTIEDCLKKVNNRFALFHMALLRVQQVRAGYPPLLQSKNKDVVVALREIAAGKVVIDKDKKVVYIPGKQERTLPLLEKTN